MTPQDGQMTVLVASERADVRSLLTGIAEQSDNAEVVGQAEDAGTTMDLVRQLRPDIALVDYHLPYVTGTNTAPMSRMSGLDAAQAISRELPETTVVVVGNLDEDVLATRGMSTKSPAILTAKGSKAAVPLELTDIRAADSGNGDIVYADVNMQPWLLVAPVRSSFTEKALVGGIVAWLAGWLMILTFVLAPVGVFLASAGAVVILTGIGSLWLRRRGRKTVALHSHI